jgi:hypothetical protein
MHNEKDSQNQKNDLELEPVFEIQPTMMEQWARASHSSLDLPTIIKYYMFTMNSDILYNFASYTRDSLVKRIHNNSESRIEVNNIRGLKF